MKRKYIVITFAVLLTFLAIKFYMDSIVNPILLASYGGEINTRDTIELILLCIFLLCLPCIMIISGFKIRKITNLIFIWTATIIIYFFVPITDFIQGYDRVIKIEQKETDLPVILKCNGSFTRIYNVKFPFKLEVKNKAIARRKIDVVDYYYNSGKKTTGENRGWDDFNDLYIQDDDSITAIPYNWEANQYKTLKGLETIDLIVYTTHRPDTSATMRMLLDPYLEQMKEQNVTTMNVGSLQQLMKSNPEFVHELLPGDEITVINWGKRKRHLSNIINIKY